MLYQYTYDNAGNILTANGKTYTYGNAVWKDLLTKYDGQSIAYEGQTISGNTVTGTPKSGNPISYYNGTRWTFDWQEGRKLVSADSNVYSIDYTYDLNGLRTSKEVNDVIHNYYYASGKLLRETYGGNTLDFFYDNSGYPYALKYNGILYYYITNLQGDVLHLTNTSGTVVVSYTYDPYGKPLAPTGTMATTLGAVNPLRYRGYYYDTETGFYYLQSRYYDPTICRFINADSYASTGQGVVGSNMFVYCLNNPVNLIDYDGKTAEALFLWWSGGMGWICAVDGPIPIADIFFSGVLSILAVAAAVEFVQNTSAYIGTTVTIDDEFEEETAIITEKMADSLAKATTPNEQRTYHKHHIVAQSDPRAVGSRMILEYLFDDGVNIPQNLIMVDSTIHRRLHTNAYFLLVEHVIISKFEASKPNKQAQRDSVLEALAWLAGFIGTLSAKA